MFLILSSVYLANTLYIHVCNPLHCIAECDIAKSAYGKEWICMTCLKYLRTGKTPPQAAINRMELFDIPNELECLNSLEKQLIALIIPFMHIVALPRGGQRGIDGPAVCVPADMQPIQTILPRQLDTDLISIKLKRKIEYKSHYNYQTISPQKVKAAFLYLKEHNQYYRDIPFDDN
jgi:hypothetical protein